MAFRTVLMEGHVVIDGFCLWASRQFINSISDLLHKPGNRGVIIRQLYNVFIKLPWNPLPCL